MAQKKYSIEERYKKNNPKSYATWLAENGVSAEGEGLDKIAAALSNNILKSPKVGASFESLAMDNLDKSGYANYLKSQQTAKTENLLKSAEGAVAEANYKNASGYGKYLSKYKSLQDNIASNVTELLVDERCFDPQKAFRIAIEHGLSEENAKLVSSSATTEAMEKVAKEAISYARSHNYSRSLARRYAKKLGLNDAYAEKVANEVYLTYND